MSNDIIMQYTDLKRLTKGDYKVLEKKNIYFFGFSPDNIQYFFECFPQYAEKVCGVFAVLDIDERTPMFVDIKEKSYRIKSKNEIKVLSATDDILIIMYEYEKEAYEKILSIHKKGNLNVRWFASKITEIELYYREKFKVHEAKNIILFKSGARKYVYGEDFNDNAKALFEYMLKNGYNKKWKLVWIVFHPEHRDYDIWKQYENVEFIGVDYMDSEEEEKRELYYKYLSTAKYAFVTDDELFFCRRRKDQILVQLWHGDGVKGRTRFRVMEKRFEYMVCTGRFFAEVDCKDFGLRSNQMLPCGLPKDDWVFSSTDNVKQFEKDIEGFDYYILWGPTFRKSVNGLELLNENVTINETGLPILNTWDMYSSLNEKLRALNCLLLIKLHPVADVSVFENKQFSNIRLMTNQNLFEIGLHINQIMPLFDAFISDYSSAATSFMSLDRPIAFTLDDLDEYENSRGFVLLPVRDYLPGKEIFNSDDLFGFVEEICKGRDTSAEKRRKLSSMMLDYKDGCNSKRLLEMLSIKE